VLDALAEAHRLDVLHRDVKPSNLLFDAGGSARLADFGAAHMSESDATVTVGEIGTVAYMAPEQRAGRAATVQSDVYGVGVMLYEMLVGELPPQRGDAVVTPAHPDLEAGHDAVIRRFLAADPAQRYGGALDARRGLEALSWPTRIVARERKPRATQSPAIATSDRFEDPKRAGQRHDRWLGRDVIVLSLSEATLARAAAIARAGHEALPAVLRADRHAGEIWIDAPRGRPLSQGLTLGDDERARLAAALAALHAAGGAHGAVDADHVFVHAGAVYLAFATVVGEASPERDMAALAAL
jgi:serine/threonine-protein kinase